jgi:hypothetical protein
VNTNRNTSTPPVGLTLPSSSRGPAHASIARSRCSGARASSPSHSPGVSTTHQRSEAEDTTAPPRPGGRHGAHAHAVVTPDALRRERKGGPDGSEPSEHRAFPTDDFPAPTAPTSTAHRCLVSSPGDDAIHPAARPGLLTRTCRPRVHTSCSSGKCFPPPASRVRNVGRRATLARATVGSPRGYFSRRSLRALSGLERRSNSR